MIFNTLFRWYVNGDRRGDCVVIPLAHLQRVIMDVAKLENKTELQMPWETGEDHDVRMELMMETR